jgi:translation initiation factor 1A
LKEDGQEYGQVLRMLGNGRLDAQCFDGTKRLCHIRGKMRKKVWVNQGDIVLISLRDFQDGKADVILKYTAEEARRLKQLGHLPDATKINETETIGSDDDEELVAFEFSEI